MRAACVSSFMVSPLDISLCQNPDPGELLVAGNGESFSSGWWKLPK